MSSGIDSLRWHMDDKAAAQSLYCTVIVALAYIGCSSLSTTLSCLDASIADADGGV